MSTKLEVLTKVLMLVKIPSTHSVTTVVVQGVFSDLC